MQDDIKSIVEDKKKLITYINDTIWDYAETKFDEVKSCELLCRTLEDEGFDVKREAAGMKTSFTASFGYGKPVIGILGEFDALKGLSQRADVFERAPIDDGGNGHGCGHQGLAAGSVGAAIAVKEYLKKNNMDGTIRYYGCPAEEGGSGKVYMVRDGLFNDVDTVLTWHPGPVTTVACGSTYSNMQVYFRFTGRSAHAAVSPHLGRSALDAVELMNVGANFLREHVEDDVKFHYAVTNTGGTAPNVVQAYSEVLYLIRSPKPEKVKEVYERLFDVAKGAALMTGTKAEAVFDKACSSVIPNKTISVIMYKNLKKYGAPDFDDEDKKYAWEIRNSLSTLEKDNMKRMMMMFMRGGSDEELDKPLADFIMPFMVIDKPSPASTDVGDVSWNVPTAQFTIASYALGTAEHSWQLVAQGKSSLFHKGEVRAAEVIASSAVELFKNPKIIEEAKEELKARKGGAEYVCPIPSAIKPGAKR